MPRGQNQKLKLFYLAKIMTQETDAEHFLTKQQIFDELAEYGVTVERKTLYEDLKTLETFGIVISAEHDGHDTIYHVTEKKFEIAEIKLLIDAVQASKFITEKKSNDLIRKLAGFASSYEADQLSKQVVVPVAVSGQFFGWVFGTGGDVKIAGPKEVAKEYKNMS